MTGQPLRLPLHANVSGSWSKPKIQREERRLQLKPTRHRIVHLELDVSRFRWQRDLAIRAAEESQARARRAHALEAHLDFISGQLAQRNREFSDSNLLRCRLSNELNELWAPRDAAELKLEESKRALQELKR